MESDRYTHPSSWIVRHLHLRHLASSLGLLAIVLSMLWFPSARTSAQPPDLDAPFATPLYLMHVIGQVFGGVEYPYDFYFAFVEQPNAEGWVLAPDGIGGYIATHTSGPVTGPHTTPRQACQALPAGVTTFNTVFAVVDCTAAIATPTRTPIPTSTPTKTPIKTPTPTATTPVGAPALTAKAVGGDIVVCSANAQSRYAALGIDSTDGCITLTAGKEVEIEEGASFMKLLNEKRRNTGLQVSAVCAERVMLLLELIYSDRNLPEDEGQSVTMFLVHALMPIISIACNEGPSASSALTDIVQEDTLFFDLFQGQVEVKKMEKAVSLGIGTVTVTVSAADLNHFLIRYDPTTKVTEITSFSGSLEVVPGSASLPAFTLEPYRKVTVSTSAVSKITAFPCAYVPNIVRK